LSTVFVPEVTKAERVVETRVAPTLNLPPAGTLMRATIGLSVILFRLPSEQYHQPDLAFTGIIYPGDWNAKWATTGKYAYTFELASPWTFEILDTPEDAA
jgi:hypothetical protein